MHGELAVFATVAVAHALAVMTPGPDFAVVMRQSLIFGRTAGLWTAAGIGSGIVLHVGYGLFGLHWLTRTWPGALDAMALLGAGVLLWLGVQALRARPVVANAPDQPPPLTGTAKRFFAIGAATNALNPKAMLFFVALFSAVVTGAPSPGLKLALGVWLPLATFGWFTCVAMLLSAERLRNRLHRAAHWIDRAMGAVLVALGVWMLLRWFG